MNGTLNQFRSVCRQVVHRKADNYSDQATLGSDVDPDPDPIGFSFVGSDLDPE